MSVLASRNCRVKDIVYTGQLTALEQCRDYLMPFKDLYDVNFIIPEDAVFATAIGSCLAGE
jgi:type II pantothenate kinase